MAQALFDEHPLEQYLRDAGEVQELMPGISQDIVDDIDIDRHLYAFDDEDPEMDWRPQCLVVGLNVIENFLASTRPPNPCNPFVERFKYNVISSSLLSTSLSTPPSNRSSLASIPGKLPHSRGPSLDLDKPEPPALVAQPHPQYGLISFAALATAFFLSLGRQVLATLSLGGLSYLAYNLITASDTPSHDFTPSIDALDELVAANNTWESTVKDAIHILEKEEATLLRSPTANPIVTTSNPLRVALHSTLQTTRTQCDNVRQLFSAITSPSELSQLSEMYAPPSPVKSPLFLPEASPRPASFPSRQLHPCTPENKRSTWNGSYSSLATIGSPTSAFRRRDKHRSNLSSLFQTPSSLSPNATSPTTPFFTSPGPSLAQVAEDLENENEDLSSIFQDDPFGPAALGLGRKRKTDGFEAFIVPPETYFTPELKSPRNRFSTTFSSSSRFTTMQGSRHPLSLFALNQVLQSALSSKRYTCSHLLALRFYEDEEEYWENVKSMIELLTSTLADESARLAEALEDLERQNLRDQNPTPDTSLEFDKREQRKLSHERVSFAPLPSHISRFAAHVAAITSALDDAREHLEECVSVLKEEPSESPPKPRSVRHSRSLSQMQLAGQDPESGEHRAIQAYERLRRELGLALRECERGKQRLVDIVHPPVVSSDDESDDVPGFGHDASDESDKPDPASPSEDEEEPASYAVANPEPEVADGLALDDVTSHLMLSSSIQHLPPPGIEQVYEADTSNVTPFTRERSKLSREERIKLNRAKRESGAANNALGLSEPETLGKLSRMEAWGPGGEVVQELKDVIWKVSERKRKMQESQLPQPQPQSQLPETPASPSPSPSS